MTAPDATPTAPDAVSTDGRDVFGGARVDGPVATEPPRRTGRSDGGLASFAAALVAWWHEGLRTVFFQRPRWSRVRTTPGATLAIVVVTVVVGIALERATIVGAATWYWQAIHVGWLGTCVALWVCWSVRPTSDVAGSGDAAPGAAALFTMAVAQALPSGLVLAVVELPLVRAGLVSPERIGPVAAWVAWLAPTAWIIVAQLTLLWRGGTRRPVPRAAAIAVLAVVLAFVEWTRPVRFWYPVVAPSVAAEEPRPLTQQDVERQGALLPVALAALAAERPGVVDVYAITYAPYADEDVFHREGAMVAGVMRDRFGATGRTVELVNHADTTTTLPWATPTNLRRTIAAMAARMNRDEDVLFVHLTSHGARDGKLSTRFDPLSIEELTPDALKGMLDEAHVRYRVLSVSACFSGSWIEPLANDDTLVMTAADADHTSYGCGRGSELTYFGRAMFDEELRRTLSFEDAHARARVVIDARERRAGKKDGYSNPQIRVGRGIRERLARLARERAATPAPATSSADAARRD